MAIPVASGIPYFIQGKHIPGEEDVGGGDRLSRPALVPSWESVIVACPEVKLWRPCQVPPVLLSTLASTLSPGSIAASDAKETSAILMQELVTSRTG
jgi:hypothetical protein